jgi:hypothetical protein
MDSGIIKSSKRMASFFLDFFFLFSVAGSISEPVSFDFFILSEVWRCL